jgi:hypothetical protein
MDVNEVLRASQEELMKHHWDTFCTQPLSVAKGGKGVIVPGCVHCKILLYTTNQFLSHLALDVLPQIIEQVIAEKPFEQRQSHEIHVHLTE